jgi:hypothetical protein
MRACRRAVTSAAVLFALTSVAAAAKPVPLITVEAAYVVLGPQGPVARTVYRNAKNCPSLNLDGASRPMGIRMVKNADFPVLVCELLIPSGTASVKLGKQKLPLPPTTLASIAVIGDTGCRLKGGHHGGGQFQDCDSDAQWPFSGLAKSVAGKQPQAVLHVGDYLYRESPCPAQKHGCKGSPYGDNWATWKADFFKPAKPLLAVAPWIAVRGNHEDCARSGEGFMLFLDPTLAQNQQPPACADLNPQFTVNVGGQSIIVIDSSNADDDCPPGACASTPYAQQFDAMTPANGAWLASHRPFYSFVNTSSPINSTLQQALAKWQGKPPPGIALALSGHIHLWEALSFADQRAPQFVIGNGGTKLDSKIQGSLNGLSIGGTTVAYGNSFDKWGYTIFTPNGGSGGWTATNYNVQDNSKFTCSVTSTAVSCP